MPVSHQSTLRNGILRAMPPGDFALLAPHLVPAPAARGTVLFDKDAVIDSVFFLERGIGSLVLSSEEGVRAETGIFGREGFTPVPIAMGSDRSPYRVLIQVAGDGLRLGAGALQDAMGRSRTLHEMLLRYAQVLSIQTAYTALSNAVHPIEERLARWLLMCHDRADGDEIALTHEFMAVMLAVRRPSVTTSLHMLEGNGFIRAERGLVVVRDRAGLQEFAGDAYGAPEREYERLIGRCDERSLRPVWSYPRRPPRGVVMV